MPGMGCTSSVTYTSTSCSTLKSINGRFKPELKVTLAPKADLTQHEAKIVRSTWPLVAQDLSGNGLQIFLKIFELRPDVKKLFHVENVRHSELARNQVIKGHGTRFMSAIGVVVDSINESDDTKQKLVDVLHVLGQQHKRYSGFRPDYFETFYEALMWRWEMCMQELFTPDVASTWSHLFVYMMEQLKEGYSLPDNSTHK